MQVIYLANAMPWFGTQSGYERLPAYIRALGVETRSYVPKVTFLHRAVGKAASLWRGHGRCDQGDAFARVQMELVLRTNKRRLGHLLYGEWHLPFWRDVPPSLLRRTVLTLHQPPSNMREDHVRALPAYRQAIVLWQGEQDWFKSKLGGGAVRFIRYGVDTEFFTPGTPATTNAPSAPPRALYSGLHLRNSAMLSRIILKWNRRRGDLHFDLLVPPQGRTQPGLEDLRGLPNITWHAGLPDTALRELYRQARFLLLPMQDSAASTAVVEALACGLPIVTTDVGGIRDYGGGTLFPMVKNNDDDGMIALMEDYLARPAWRDEVGARCRAFAETELAWPTIARRHLDFYREIAP